ncbi:MFS transporter [Actinomyces sp. 2119]|uniref:MFS transporter n=1 Tax=Actinomyces sp. 2119 TaxID=2321393 RepID=UPI000E6CF37D|nr:MFS transporter [Actinomyces sp. 2119]RJF43112.1 MFS transporter [Actinomyces sp. 2119]
MPASRRVVVSSLWLVFLVNGAVLASWAPRIPDVRQRLGLSDADLGVALLGVALGAVPAMLVTARLVGRVSDVAVCAVAALVFPAALPLIDVVTGLPGLMAVLMLLGAASGCLDIAMNTLAVRLQVLWRTRVLGRLHGAYSLGVLAATAAAAVATYLGLSVGRHFVAVSATLLLAAASASVVLLTRAPRTAPTRSSSEERAGSVGSGDAKPGPPRRGQLAVPGLTLGVGVIAVGGFLLEGLLTDWSALLLRRDLGAQPTLAASVLSMFSVAMFVSRSLSDALLRRVEEATLLRAAAVLLALAVPTGLATGSVPATVVGVVVTGACVGPLFPLALAQAGRVAAHNAAGVAGVAGVTARLSVVGYAAHLGGPVLIGFAAEGVGLPTTVTAVVVATAVLLALTTLPRLRTSDSGPP